MKARVLEDCLVRRARRDDREEIRRIFASTLALGRPVSVGGVGAYADFSLDWYLDGSDAAQVHLERHHVTGYVLVCTDEDAYEAHRRRAALRYGRALLRTMANGHLDAEARRFHRLRIQDGWRLYRQGPVRPADAHIHLNLRPGARASQAGRRLVDAADQVVDRAGLDAWYAQINAPVGRRADALVRLGAEVIHRDENLTLTAWLGRPVERLTILRRL